MYNSISTNQSASFNSNTNASESNNSNYEIFQDMEIEDFYNLFDRLTIYEKVALYNEYAYETGNEPIYHYREFWEELNYGVKTQDAIQRAFFGYDRYFDRKEQFNPNRDWYMINGYGNYVSIEEPFYYSEIEGTHDMEYMIDEVFEWLKTSTTEEAERSRKVVADEME